MEHLQSITIVCISSQLLLSQVNKKAKKTIQYIFFNYFFRLKKFFIKMINKKKDNDEKKHRPIKFKMVSPMSSVLKEADVKITNAIHNEAIDKINKNHNKYLFIYILNSSFINPNNDIAIITRAQIYNMLPKIIKVNISFGHPK